MLIYVYQSNTGAELTIPFASSFYTIVLYPTPRIALVRYKWGGGCSITYLSYQPNTLRHATCTILEQNLTPKALVDTMLCSIAIIGVES